MGLLTDPTAVALLWLVLQPELGRSSPFPMALSGPLLMPAAPARPEAGGIAVWRLGPDQVPQQAAHFRHGERQQVGFEIDHAFFSRPRRSGSRRDRHAHASLACYADASRSRNGPRTGPVRPRLLRLQSAPRWSTLCPLSEPDRTNRSARAPTSDKR